MSAEEVDEATRQLIAAKEGQLKKAKASMSRARKDESKTKLTKQIADLEAEINAEKDKLG